MQPRLGILLALCWFINCCFVVNIVPTICGDSGTTLNLPKHASILNRKYICKSLGGVRLGYQFCFDLCFRVSQKQKNMYIYIYNMYIKNECKHNLRARV